MCVEINNTYIIHRLPLATILVYHRSSGLSTEGVPKISLDFSREL
jgi:hypothetical protein